MRRFEPGYVFSLLAAHIPVLRSLKQLRGYGILPSLAAELREKTNPGPTLNVDLHQYLETDLISGFLDKYR